MKRIAIIGAGAVGGYFGGRLAQHGHAVSFLARGATLVALKERGLRVSSPAGDVALSPAEIRASADPEELGPVDAVLVTVKAWQVPEVAPILGPLLQKATDRAEAGVVVPLQNGVEAPAQLAAVWGRTQVLGGVCRLLARQTAPAEILHIGGEPEILLGPLALETQTAATAICEAIREAGVSCELRADIAAAMWEKLAFIATFGALGAAARVPVATLRASRPTRELILQAVREVAAVAATQGASLPESLPDRILAYIDGMPPAGTSSLQRDIAAGVPSELEAIVGVLTRLGAAAGLVTPIFSTLYGCLLPSEQQVRAAR